MKNIQLIIRKIGNEWSYYIDLENGRKPTDKEIIDLVRAIISIPSQSSSDVERGD